jgi:hypothetical protein
MQFTWGSIGGTENERTELDYQLKRNSHHPSIVMWDACNECGGGGLYDSFVMPKVAQVDQSRPIWPSCPADGWASGADQLTSRPNGKVLHTRTSMPDRPSGFPFPQEAHGPYTAFQRFTMPNVTMPRGSAADLLRGIPTVVPQNFGAGEQGWYRSEFGCTGWSSFESMAGQMPSGQWSMDSAAAKNRGSPGGGGGWNVSNVLSAYFGDTAVAALAESGEAAFKRQLYQSMIGQVLNLKTEIESWRSQNVWGTTFWMSALPPPPPHPPIHTHAYSLAFSLPDDSSSCKVHRTHTNPLTNSQVQRNLAHWWLGLNRIWS